MFGRGVAFLLQRDGRCIKINFDYHFCSVILNVVKDLLLIYAFRRFFTCAQNDKMIVALYFGTPLLPL